MKYIYIYIFVPISPCLSRTGSRVDYGIAAFRRNYTQNFFFFNLCLLFLPCKQPKSPGSSSERPGCGEAPHLLSRRQPLRAAALLRTLASRSRKYSLSAEFPVIGTTSPRRRAQPSRGPWNTAALRARICRESPLTAVKLRTRPVFIIIHP